MENGFNYGDIFEAVFAECPPDQEALIEFGTGRSRTWGELRRRSENLANGLIELGLKPGDKVAIYMENRLEYVEAVLAIVE